MSARDVFDVVVIGGGPAGSVMAWSLARHGVRVAVVERATFPREKVCGDFVEPGGLQILDAMQCRPHRPLSSRSSREGSMLRSYHGSSAISGATSILR